MKVYVDADACPVKDIIIEETEKEKIPVTLVSSITHFSLKEIPNHVSTVYVDAGAEAADYKIVQLIKEKDILVTQDYGLASLALAKGAVVLHHKGFEYTTHNIDRLLQHRYYSAIARKSGKRTKGPNPLTREDKEKFRELFSQFTVGLTSQHDL